MPDTYTPTKEDIETMAHALGASSFPGNERPGWLNGVRAAYHDELMSNLVANGLMERGRNLGSQCGFHVTPAGIEAVRKAGYKVEER